MDSSGIVSFYDAVADGNIIWVVDQYHNALEKINIQEQKISLAALLPVFKDTKDIRNQYGGICNDDDRLIIIPRNSTHILIYDVITGVFKDIQINSDYISKGKGYNLFGSPVIYKETLYLIPGTYSKIVKINLKSLEITYIDYGYEKIFPTLKSPNRVVISHGLIVDNILYLTCWQSMEILKLDLDTGKIHEEKVSVIEDGISYLIYDGVFFFTSLRDHPWILKLDDELKQVECVKIQKTKKNYEFKSGIRFLIDADRHMYIVPEFGNAILRFEKSSETIKKVWEMPLETPEELLGLQVIKTSVLCAKRMTEKKVILCSLQDATVLILDTDTNTFVSMNSYLSDKADRDAVKKYSMDFCNSGTPVRESGFFTINNFIDGVKSRE